MRSLKISSQFLRLLAAATSSFIYLAGPAHAQIQAPKPRVSPFAKSVTSDSWVYRALARLLDHHLTEVSEGRYPTLGTEPISRYEAAVLTAIALERTIPATERNGSTPKMTPENRRVLAEDMALVRRLASEFSVELKTLGVDLPAAAQQLNSVEQDLRKREPPFADVAPDHWASASVERLRQAGVLVGYPGGSFVVEAAQAN